MAKVHFLLKDKNSEKDTLILIVVRPPDGRVTRSIKEFISPQEWDFHQQMPKVRRNRRDLAALYHRLAKIKIDVETNIMEHKASGRELRKIDVAGYIARVIGTDTSAGMPTIRDFTESNILPSCKPDARKLYTWVVDKVEEACGVVTVSQMTDRLFGEMIKYFGNRKKQLRMNSLRNISTGYKYIARCVESRYGINLGVSKIKAPSYEKVFRLALSVDELVQMYKYEHYSKDVRLCVDFFLIMAFTGVRRKDAFSTKGINFSDGEFYIKDTSKTGARVVVPKHWIVDEIIERNGGVPEPGSSPMTIIRNVRHGAKLSGIKGKMFYTYTISGKKETIEVDRADAISFHTARRSFATNLHKAGIPVRVAMMFTGHKTVQQFMDYIQIDEVENAEQYMNHPFFADK